MAAGGPVYANDLGTANVDFADAAPRHDVADRVLTDTTAGHHMNSSGGAEDERCEALDSLERGGCTPRREYPPKGSVRLSVSPIANHAQSELLTFDVHDPSRETAGREASEQVDRDGDKKRQSQSCAFGINVDAGYGPVAFATGWRHRVFRMDPANVLRQDQ